MADAQGCWLGLYCHGLALRRPLRLVLGSFVISDEHFPPGLHVTNNSCSAWIVVAEVWPLSAQPYDIALGVSSNWINNFIAGQVTPDMITGITYGTCILFRCLVTLGAAFIWFYGKENP